MRTIAQAYKDEGRAIDRAQASEKVAINLLKENAEVKFVADVTGLSLDDVLKLKCKI